LRILIAGGGTAGHINPALSIADFIRRKEPDSAFLFVGTREGMEKELVEKKGYPIKFIDIRGFRRSFSLENIKTVFMVFKSKAQAKDLIRAFRPDVVLCTGGYVSGPVMCAAKSMHIPCMIHEQNVIPGVTVKMAARYATKIAVSFEGTFEYLKKDRAKCVLTGNPIREELLQADRTMSRRKLNLDNRPMVFAFGGSLGADKINETMLEFIKSNEERGGKYQILFGCGKRYYEKVMEQAEQMGIDVKSQHTARIVDYIDDMGAAMAAADIVISRAGAITTSEIAAMGKVSILIPSPNVAHDHQTYNALALYEKEAGIMIRENELTSKLLETKVDKLLGNPVMYDKMAENCKKIGQPDAVKKMYDTMRHMI
jgi:UDP-N-acetylglucosamine--N-acetylmuramyl-(pentapeptide) pyrophosphoryl-undecaprenol N-acetylglucosamine transferase